MSEAPAGLPVAEHLLSDPFRVLNALFGTAVALDLAVAVWRLPQTQGIQLAVSLQPTPQTQLPVLEESPTGFLFCPFDLNGPDPIHFLTADVSFCTREQKINLHPSLRQQAEQPTLLSKFTGQLTHRLQTDAPASWHLPPEQAAPTLPKSGFTANVEEAVRQIQREEMEKVVLSRPHTVPLPPGFRLVPVVQGLAQSYPLAFVYLVSVPRSGTWLGASPETLVHVDRNKVFRTEALAGTQPYRPGTSPSEAIWRQKEIEEQSLVVRYIINCFKKIRLREYVETGPRTVIAGNLMHLRTDFKVNSKEVDFPALATQMMHLLHPTSAICGMPMEAARMFILEREGYSRGYYSGFMGPVQHQGETRLFVTLRCIQLTSANLILYAGAGVTGESVPEKEWQETEMKMETMLSVIQKYS